MREEHLRLGALLLGLVCDWDGWVSRRVDSFHFAGDDERVLYRRQSVDFTLPQSLNQAGFRLFAHYGGLPVPITFVSKWRLPEFSLRDGDDRTVSLLQRDDSTPLAAAMLVALGTFVMSRGTMLVASPGSSLEMPQHLQARMLAIAAAEPAVALRKCVDFQRPILTPGGRDGVWRRALAGDELFMSLAYELAGGFLLAAIMPRDPKTRRVLKFSYNSYVVPAERDGRLVRFGHLGRWLWNWRRDAVDPVEWRRTSSLRRRARRQPDPRKTGSLSLSTSTDGASERLRQGAPSIACGIATITGPKRRRLNVRIRPSGIVTLTGLPPGEYRIRVKSKSGFWFDPRDRYFKVAAGELRRIAFRVRRVRFARRETRAAPAIMGVPWKGKKIARGIGWNSKPLAIRVRLGGGGSYHCEFEAPPGLHVTRARLISNLDGNELRPGPEALKRRRARYVDTVLESTQRAHLYQPAHTSGPATGYAFLNLRPRAETIVRPATITAVLTVCVLVALGAVWTWPPKGFDGNDPPLGLLAIILGGPSALAAYFAQAVPSRVTNAMLYGIRLLALVPAATSLLAATAILQAGEDAGGPLIGVGVLGAFAFAALWLTYWFAEHPREQKPSYSRQGPDFEAMHLSPFGAGERVPPVPLDPGRSYTSRLAAIRDRMLERIGGMTSSTRRALLWQRSFRWWEREVPPALYFDSAEAPAVFLGPTKEDRRKLESCLTALTSGRRVTHSKPPSSR